MLTAALRKKPRVLAALGGHDAVGAHLGEKIGEIPDHLALTKRAYVGGVTELAGTAPPHEFTYEELLRQRKYRVEDLGDVAITGKFPTPPHLLPTRGKRLTDLLRALEEARGETRRLLAPFRNEDLGAKFFRHPLLGPMTLYERLANIAYHEQKHVGQMGRALARMEKRPREGTFNSS